MVRGDRILLQRMVRNLLDNAQRHGRAPIEVGVRREAGNAVLVVCDRGPGIEASEREQIFSPFYRAGSRSTSPGSVSDATTPCRGLFTLGEPVNSDDR